ncbi:MAG: PriCT-2 domain-containing protein [Candidatus Sedimenticola sp. 6PFRAG7]
MSDAQIMRVDVGDIESALITIPSDDRDTWIKVGMALKSELGDHGFEIWNHWSRSSDSYNERDARDVWRSIKDGSISIGTLLYLAKENGWKRPEKAYIKPTPTKSRTGTYAKELWLQSNPDVTTVASHSYAINKGIAWAGGAARGIASGKVIGKDADCIIVPIRDIETEKLVGVQCINPEGKKQTFGPTKNNGLLLGNTLDKHAPWYVVEGWASGFSMAFHHHMGNAVAGIAFGKHNMESLAQRMANVYSPDKIIIIEEVDG